MPGRDGERPNHDLLQAVTRGDAAAWDELTSRYGGLVRATVGSYRLQEADTADAVQSTWLRVLERGDSIKDPDRLGGWLTTTAGRECLAVIRRTRREVPAAVETMDRATPVPGPEAMVVAHAVHGMVVAVVAELTGRRRTLAHALFYRADQSYAELSGETGIPPGSIGPTRGRLLRDLRRTLQQRGVDAVA